MENRLLTHFVVVVVVFVVLHANERYDIFAEVLMELSSKSECLFFVWFKDSNNLYYLENIVRYANIYLFKHDVVIVLNRNKPRAAEEYYFFVCVQ